MNPDETKPAPEPAIQPPPPSRNAQPDAPTAQPPPPLQNSQSDDSDASVHRRNGKVARLPREIRGLVNVMLGDGVPYPLIVKKVAEHGHHLTPNNLSNWHAGGFQDWLKEQSWLEEMRARLDFASDIVQQENGELLEAASLRIAVTRMYSLLVTFDPLVLGPKIAAQPGAYARLLNVLCKLTDGAVKLERRREEKRSKTSLASPLRSPASR
jgi:hypothetical protein